MNGAQALLAVLRDRGVDLVFGYPGGAIMPLYDALVDSGIRHILVRHEQGAVFAADGYARVSGTPRRVHGDFRPGCHQPHHGHRQRATSTRCRWSRSPARWRRR